jgi:hypothetical protein
MINIIMTEIMYKNIKAFEEIKIPYVSDTVNYYELKKVFAQSCF